MKAVGDVPRIVKNVALVMHDAFGHARRARGKQDRRQILWRTPDAQVVGKARAAKSIDRDDPRRRIGYFRRERNVAIVGHNRFRAAVLKDAAKPRRWLQRVQWNVAPSRLEHAQDRGDGGRAMLEQQRDGNVAWRRIAQELGPDTIRKAIQLSITPSMNVVGY